MLFFAFLAVSASCHYASGADSWVDNARHEVISAEQAFSFDLYQVVRRAAGAGNVLVSPLSAATALTLVLQGAGGRTAAELAHVLHLPAGALGRVAFGYRALKHSLQGDEENEVILRTADKIYLQSGLHLNKRFQKMAVDYFAADAEEVDFKDSNRVRVKINQWVERKTEGKIKDLFSNGSPSANTILVVVNAIYMKATWMKTFQKQNTKPQLFHTLSGSINVPMMNKRGEFLFGKIQELDSTMLVLQYKGYESKLRMVLILPNALDGIEILESSLRSFQWDSISLASRFVLVSLPKFRIEAQHELNSQLTELGLKSLFAPGANLTGIAEDNIYVSKAVQKTYIDVDETGTEAAAATGLDVVRYSSPPPRAEFIADHPFMFLVMHEELILFMGRVTDPSQR